MDPPLQDSEPDPQHVAEVRAAEVRAEARAEDQRRQHDWALERAVKQREWYGGWVLGTDVLAGTLVVAAIPLSLVDARAPLLSLSSAAATYVFGASVVHLAHGRADSAIKSVGLRLGAPVAGALLGFGCFFTWRALDGSAKEFDRAASDGAKAFLCLGATVPTSFVAASVLDAAVLSWARPRLGPTVEVSRDGATLGVQGTL